MTIKPGTYRSLRDRYMAARVVKSCDGQTVVFHPEGRDTEINHQRVSDFCAWALVGRVVWEAPR